jgi:gas vesicle protein
MSTGKVVIGVLAGVTIGALLGVLFAPDKGSETRKKLAKTGKESINDLREKLNELIKSYAEKFEAEETVHKEKKQIEELKRT